MVELEAWVVMRVVVNCGANSGSLELAAKLVDLVVQALVVSILVENGNKYGLDLGYAWW